MESEAAKLLRLIRVIKPGIRREQGPDERELADEPVILGWKELKAERPDARFFFELEERIQWIELDN